MGDWEGDLGGNVWRLVFGGVSADMMEGIFLFLPRAVRVGLQSHCLLYSSDAYTTEAMGKG